MAGDTGSTSCVVLSEGADVQLLGVLGDFSSKEMERLDCVNQGSHMVMEHDLITTEDRVTGCEGNR